MAHNIHRTTASECRLTHLLRIISNRVGEALWAQFDDRPSTAFEAMCNVPISDSARAQALLPTEMAGLRLYAAVDIAPCAYDGSLVDSAFVRADGFPRSTTTTAIYKQVQSLIPDLQPSLSAPAEGTLPPRNPRLLDEMPVSTQKVLFQAVFHRRLREAKREDAFVELSSGGGHLPPTADAIFNAVWEMIHTKRRILAILRPEANAFLKAKPCDEPFCPPQV